MKFMNKNINVENVLLVDGITRTGKFLLGKVLSEFEGIEFFQYLHILEQVPFLYGMNKIEEDAAIALIKSAVDFGVYDRCLGRNLNCRPSDRTSIYNSTDLGYYLKRQFSDYSNSEVLEFMREKSSKFLFVTHDALANIRIFLRAYPRITVIHMVRNPVELVYSWTRNRIGEVYSDQMFHFNVELDKEKTPMPWYSNDWDIASKELNSVDVVIKSVQTLNELIGMEYAKLSEKEKKRILIVGFEELIMDTSPAIDRISSFIGLPVTSKVRAVLVKEGCPDRQLMEKYEEKRNTITSKASDEFRNILYQMEQKYLASKATGYHDV